jgi:hypothetical protein
MNCRFATMRILSFDCANRSLAVCYADIDTNIYDNIADAMEEKDIEKVAALINNYINIKILKVFDLTKGKKCTTIERSILLKACLTDLDKLIGAEHDCVLVEYQMSANDKSRCVSQQIVYHYTGCAPVYLVGPTLKNKISFHPSMDHGSFMAKYASKYTANKNHSKKNFLHWCKLFGQEECIKGIAKKNLDDVADAFMQILGWLEYGKK